MPTRISQSAAPRFPGLAVLLMLLVLTACSHPANPDTVVMVIESSPANLDPRVGTDAFSEHIDMLLFDALLRRGPNFEMEPGLATSWEARDPLTYVFHLRSGVRFSNGQALTSRDVKWTLDSVVNGSLRTPKSGTYQYVQSVDAPNADTVVIHLKQPDSSLLWNLSEGALGIVPYGSGADFNRHPVGTGPFVFVSQRQDRDVVLEHNPNYWDASRIPHVERVRFSIVPDAITRALELRKGSADIVLNALTPDTAYTLSQDRRLVFRETPGTVFQYLAFNLRDPILKNVLVRRAIAHAIDRAAIIHNLLRDEARPAASILPPQSWAYDGNVKQYAYDPARARQLLDEAGLKPGADGIRFHITMKTSTQEASRLFAAVLQQQFRAVGIALDIQSLEWATFYSDVTKGSFQLYSLRWVGGNEDPDIFEDVFASSSFPPHRANRGFYSNPQVDALLAQARGEMDPSKRALVYAQIQEIVARDLPYVNLWYEDNVLVHTRRVRHFHVGASGDFGFLSGVDLTGSSR